MFEEKTELRKIAIILGKIRIIQYHLEKKHSKEIKVYEFKDCIRNNARIHKK